MTAPARRTEYLPLDDIQFAPRNPKGHATDAIAASIDEFGLGELPLLDERTGRLVAGHGRIIDLRARRDAGQDPPDGVTVDGQGRWLAPVNRGWSSRSDAQAAAYLAASNRLGELGGWDNAGLADLLTGINDVDPALLAATGFSDADLLALLNGAEPIVTELPPALGDPDAVPAPPVEPVTKPGDVWTLGPHKVVCGDSRDFETVARLLGDVRVNVAFTSPPYASQRKYDESSGFRPIPPDEYVDWFEDVQANVRAVLAEDGSWFVNIKPSAEDLDTHLYVFDLVIAHVRRWGWHFATEFCWERTGMPKQVIRRFKNQFEPVYQFATGSWKIRPSQVAHESDAAIAPLGVGAGDTNWADDLGKRGFGAHEIGAGMAYPGNRLPVFASATTGHTAAFPVGLPTWFIRAYSDEGDAVFDPFMGSGTTLIAAHLEQRVAYGCEISPAYTDVICRRFQDATGIKPILESTGKPHDFTTGA